MQSLQQLLDALIADDGFRQRFESDRESILGGLSLSPELSRAMRAMDVSKLAERGRSVGDDLLRGKHI